MAQVCLDHELFDGRLLIADYWDGKTSFEESIPTESELPTDLSTETPVEDFAFGSLSPNCSYEILRDTQTWKRRQKIDNPMLATKREMNKKTTAKKENNNNTGYVLIWWAYFANMACKSSNWVGFPLFWWVLSSTQKAIAFSMVCELYQLALKVLGAFLAFKFLQLKKYFNL